MIESFNKRICISIFFAIFMPLIYCGSVSCAPRQLVAVRVNTSPVIDGKLDDACWKDAAQATEFSVLSNPEQMHPQQTLGRICFDDDNIYISVMCNVTEMGKFRTQIAKAGTDFDYWNGGVVEIFFDPNHSRKTYQQYLFHANGSTYTALPPDDLLKILNQDFMTVKSVLTETGYNIEMAIPLAMLHLRPDTAKVWGFNLNRYHDTYGETMDKDAYCSSWNSTLGAGFPTPSRFGDLVLDVDLSRFYWRVDFTRQPQPSDKTIEVRIENQTGRDFNGQLTLSILPPEGKKSNYEKTLTLTAGQFQEVFFDHAVSAQDAEAKYTLSLSDSSGRICYLGGMETRDLTLADKWQPPTPSEQQKKDGYLLFGRPYTQPVLYKSVPKSEELISSLSMSACRGEFEPVTFSIYPLRNLESVKVTASDLKGPNASSIPASSIDIRQVTYQSVWKDIRSFTAVEHLLRKFDTLSLTKGRTQRLWLTIKIPEKAQPGRYLGTVSVVTGQSEMRLPLQVHVLSFELSEPDEMAYFMYFPNVGHEAYSNESFFRKIVKDQRDHGMTSFTIYNIYAWDGSMQIDSVYPGWLPAPRYGVSYATMMKILQDAGIGSSVPLLEISNMSPDVKTVMELFKVYHERNWPQVAFYISDEIDFPERIEAARGPLEALKKAAPNIKTATALGHIGKAALGHMYDIWIGSGRPEDVNECIALGKAPWTYSCRQIHEIGCAFVRNFFGRHPFRVGLKGVSLWSYTDSDVFFNRYGQKIKYPYDTGFTPDMMQQHGHVYFEKNEIIPVVTWEAVREGIDDYRYLLTLKKAAQAAIDSRDVKKRAAGEKGMKTLKAVTDGISPEYALDDKKFGQDWQVFDDMDGYRTKVIEAILKIEEEN